MNFRKLTLGLILLALFIAPRLAGLRSFVTLDEPFWLSVGANFYYALGQREFQHTVYEYHPAVTTMWFVTGAMLAYFPEYRGLGQGYFDVDKNKFDPFLLEHGISPLTLLYEGRLLQLVLLTGLMLLIFHLLAVLAGAEQAFLVSALMAAAPFFLGHSLLLNHEALLALCVLTSIFGLLAYLWHRRRLPYLLISAAAAALAQLTKSSAIAMMPVIGLILAVSVFEDRPAGLRSVLWDRVRGLGTWLATLVIVYVALWPGMWVAPGKMLYEVYGNAFSYAFQGARLQVTQELQPSQFSLETVGPTAAAFFQNLLWRSTPIMWFGMLIAVASLLLPAPFAPQLRFKWLIGYLLVTAALFILMFSAAQGRNSQHYVMTSHLSLEAVAGLGWGVLPAWLSRRWRSIWGVVVVVILIGAPIALQLWSALAFRPYSYTYYNPLMARITGHTIPYYYGEGLEQVAAYLRAKPGAETMAVLAYPARGPFSYFFPGETLILNPLYLEDPGMPSMFERLEQAEYLVFYDGLADRTPNSRRFVRALESSQPEAVLSVQGLEKIFIYRVAEISPDFYAALSQ